ncbi:hypothetical protein psyc5s11_41810 [Clostridium gelidum]|uniref:Lipoprotein n=1 Tax=Clostridium gelidum TaxID=704125 RepID=A0ABM7TI28_9CLOT|nr:hypothetical protein [Clostridium gelidum]BCZ48114.1 hypothetical protein psyc5s11_41810 [Clostridium gelidum]
MKKVTKLFSILSLVTLILVVCSNSNENNAQKVAKEFETELYTVDSNKINDYNNLIKIKDVQALAETMQSNDKTIKSLMTEEGYNSLVANRFNTLNTQGCAEGNYTMQVTDLTLSQNSYDIKENKAGYNFETKLKFSLNKDNTEQTDVGKGYIGLSKENGQWKVFVYRMTVLPKLIEETLSNK